MRLWKLALGGLLLIGVPLSWVGRAAGSGSAPHVSDEVLVKFKDGTEPHRMEAALVAAGAVSAERLAPSILRAPFALMERWRNVKLAPDVEAEEAVERLSREPVVEHAELNYIWSIDAIPKDESFPQLWGLHNTGSSGVADADIDAPEAWNIQTGSDSVVVAVIDTGVDFKHPDLAANMWTNSGETPGNGVDDDGNGYVDDIYGYDFVNRDPVPFDDNRHGTHVAGTIAAVGNNGIGVTGVSWKARIMALKFLGATGSGSTSGAVSAVLYATAVGARATNNSWGGGGFSVALRDAIAVANSAGSLFVAAAGNSRSNNDAFPHYPSSYDVPNVLAVAATDPSDALAGFSSYGATSVDMGAPGVSVYSTVPGGQYANLSGTSMATPHVAGAAALLLAQSPGLSHAELKTRLMTFGDPLPALAGRTVSGRRLNVYKALVQTQSEP